MTMPWEVGPEGYATPNNITPEQAAANRADAAAQNIGASGMTFQRLSGAAQAVQGFAQMASAYAGYTQTGIQADWLKLQADQVGIQAEQKANILRENLFGMISNAMAGYGARGVDVGSGTPMRQAELSLKEGGQDLQQIKRNADMEASTLRAQAKIMKAGARAGMVGGMLSGVSSVLSGAVTAFGGGK